ncbi:MAG: hypothetical protein ACI8RD_013525, partial [Bacillariaceae sp.]
INEKGIVIYSGSISGAMILWGEWSEIMMWCVCVL